MSLQARVSTGQGVPTPFSQGMTAPSLSVKMPADHDPPTPPPPSLFALRLTSLRSENANRRLPS
jgi:hypothetical protein